MKRLHEFTCDERLAIRDRRSYQSVSELARVFGTSTQAIAAICRRDQVHTTPPESA